MKKHALHENLWKPWKSTKYYESQQEASLESGKGSHKGNKSSLADVTPMLRNLPKSMQIYGNLWNTMKDIGGQEANLELNKGVFRNRGPPLPM